MNNKLLALAKHLDLSFLIWEDDIIYNVSLEEFNKLSGTNYGDVEDIFVDNEVFLKYLKKSGSNFSDEVEVNENYYIFGNEEYLILKDDEADESAREYAESLIEDCYITKEIRESFIYNHIDMDSAIEDVLQDGRGVLLASYDGTEEEIKIEDEWYYIYRIN